jgi:hypothetical protein
MLFPFCDGPSSLSAAAASTRYGVCGPDDDDDDEIGLLIVDEFMSIFNPSFRSSSREYFCCVSKTTRQDSI